MKAFKLISWLENENFVWRCKNVLNWFAVRKRGFFKAWFIWAKTGCLRFINRVKAAFSNEKLSHGSKTGCFIRWKKRLFGCRRNTALQGGYTRCTFPYCPTVVFTHFFQVSYPQSPHEGCFYVVTGGVLVKEYSRMDVSRSRTTITGATLVVFGVLRRESPC